ncbi:DNA-3-methyladenine glycosylase I [Ekhidna sp.]
MKDYLVKGPDNKVRCSYLIHDADFKKYHDEEWGRPVSEDRRLFEKICIEGFVSGLSYITLLKKRENFREAFDNFDHEKVASYDEEKLNVLMQNKGLIRNKRKLKSVINNAKRMPAMIEEFGSLAKFVWSFRPDSKNRPGEFNPQTLKEVTKTKESEELARALKKRGWTYVGPTNMYAMMQSVGIVNDHFSGCHYREECLREMKVFQIP